MRPTPLISIALSSGLLFLAACSGGSGSQPDPSADAAPPPGPTVVLTRLRVADGTPPDLRPVAIEQATLEKALESALAKAGMPRSEGQVPPKAWKAKALARVIYGLTDGEGLLKAPTPESKARAVWQVELSVKPPQAYEDIYLTLEGEDEVPYSGDPAGVKAALEARVNGALSTVTAGAEAQVKVMLLKLPQLIKRLADEDPAVRDAVIGRISMLRDKAAVPDLVARLKVEEERVLKLRIIGALEELGDPRADEALIALANPRDREMLSAVVYALSAVGGDRARDFLDVLGTHDAADVRAMVEDARKRLDRRQPVVPDKQGAPDEPPTPDKPGMPR